jgi:hypothetical protein
LCGPCFLLLPFFAALHRQRRELGLRLIAADDEHQDVLPAGLVVADVHEAPRHADRKGDDIQRAQVDVLLSLAFIPFAAPAPGHGDEGLVGIVVVHQRPLAGLRLAVAQVEAFRDGDGGHRRGVVADRRGDGLIIRTWFLKADHCIELPATFRQRAVGQAAVRTFQLPEPRDALHHFRACQGADVFPGFHSMRSFSGMGVIIKGP